MIKAYVNEMGIVLELGSTSDDLSDVEWKKLLDELKSHHIPSFYPTGNRMHIGVDSEGKKRAVIYFTPQTVPIEKAMSILAKRGVEVHDVRDDPKKP
jgi:hypothetical protein